MASGFNMARAEIIAKREGITFSEACSRMARAGHRRRREKARQNACVTIQPTTVPKARPLAWWQREALS